MPTFDDGKKLTTRFQATVGTMPNKTHENVRTKSMQNRQKRKEKIQEQKRNNDKTPLSMQPREYKTTSHFERGHEDAINAPNLWETDKIPDDEEGVTFPSPAAEPPMQDYAEPEERQLEAPDYPLPSSSMSFD
jgi:hypothetical protein